MSDTTIDFIDDLINKKFTLQRDILHSWGELRKMELKHSALLSELNRVREQIKYECEPSLFDQLFGDSAN
jgi:hypothetical protein